MAVEPCIDQLFHSILLHLMCLSVCMMIW